MSDEMKMEDAGDEEPCFVVRCRGLPWQVKPEEVVEFFDGLEIKGGIDGVHLTLSRDGRPSGEAYVEFETEEDVKKALDMNKKHLGSRYIEIFQAKKTEYEWALRKSCPSSNDSVGDPDTFLRLRGLPFDCTVDDIRDFFTGLEILGIIIPTDHQDRSKGEAYVQFANRADTETAQGKHKEKIGHRWIEIFKSSPSEYKTVENYMMNKTNYSRGGGGRYGGGYPRYPARPAPYHADRGHRGGFGGGGGFAPRGPPPRRGRGGGNGYHAGGGGGGGGGPIRPGAHVVHMRGLPYKATIDEIYDFFLPLNPVNVHILEDSNGRSSGEADVEFASHEEATKAMNKDRAYMQKRYIELFYNNSP